MHLIGERPGEVEDSIGCQFKGPAGRMLRSWLHDINVNPDNCNWDNAVKCGGDPGKPTLKQIRLCRPFTLRNLEGTKPGAVVALGEKATIALTDDGNAKVKNYRNRDLDIPGLSFKPRATTTFHPAAYLHGNHRVREDIKEDVTRFLSKKDTRIQIKAVTTLDGVKQTCKRFSRLDAFSFDLEWGSETGKLLIVGLYDGETAYWFPVEHRESTWVFEDVADHLKLLFDNEVTKLGYSMSGDMIVLADRGVNTGGKIFDAFTLVKMIDENYPDKSLEHIAMKVLGFPDYSKDMRVYKKGIKVSSGEVTKQGKPKLRLSKDYGNAPLDIIGPYCAWDAAGPYEIAAKYIEDAKQEKWWKLFQMYMRGIKVLTRSSYEGFLVDRDGELKTQEKNLRAEVKKTQKEFIKLWMPHWYKNRPVAWKKNDIVPRDEDIRDMLYRRLKLPVTETTKEGNPAAGRKVLQILVLKYPKYKKLFELLIELKKADKLLGTYMLRMREKMKWREAYVLKGIKYPAGWYFRPGYNVPGARTMRLSSRPNIQNIPKKTIRKAFISRWAK